MCYTFLMLFAASNLYAGENKKEESNTKSFSLSEKENKMIAHVQNSIALADKGHSRLNAHQLSISGMSSPKVRHFLNNLCTFPETSYLEIGVWKGSTLVSALYQNQGNVSKAIAIDNFSQFNNENTRQEFTNNCNSFLPEFKEKLQFFSADCFNIDKASIFTKPVNIYFYDGDHTALAQELAFTYYNGILDDVFIAIVDDWNYAHAREATLAAFKKLNYSVLYDRELPANYNGDVNNWWNGLYVAVIRKN